MDSKSAAPTPDSSVPARAGNSSFITQPSQTGMSSQTFEPKQTDTGLSGSRATDDKVHYRDEEPKFLTPPKDGEDLRCPFSTDVDLADDRVVGQWTESSVVIGDSGALPKRPKRVRRGPSANTEDEKPSGPERALTAESIESTDGPEHPDSARLRMVYRSLPTFFEVPGATPAAKKLVVQTAHDIPKFLEMDMDLSRLNNIHSSLWMAGRPLHIRPLHRHTMLNRSIVVTQQADMHVVVDGDTLYLKPLPLYLLSRRFWKLYLRTNRKVHGEACGMLLSYVFLIRTELDFSIAANANLLPRTSPPISWDDWSLFACSVMSHIDFSHYEGVVNLRFMYGELRLGRINTIYRLAPRFFLQYFIRGYLYKYNRYTEFFQRRLAWLLVLFVGINTVLAAMQVGMAVSGLAGSPPFVSATFGFVIFSICFVTAIVLFTFLLFGGIYLANMVIAISHSWQAHRDRGRALEETTDPESGEYRPNAEAVKQE